MAQHTSYHFDLGNSNTGPVGYSGAVCARNKRDAVARFFNLLDENLGPVDDVEIVSSGSSYACVYLNLYKISTRHIDEVSDCECDALGGD